jgi:hypothetical protein
VRAMKYLCWVGGAHIGDDTGSSGLVKVLAPVSAILLVGLGEHDIILPGVWKENIPSTSSRINRQPLFTSYMMTVFLNITEYECLVHNHFQRNLSEYSPHNRSATSSIGVP